MTTIMHLEEAVETVAAWRKAETTEGGGVQQTHTHFRHGLDILLEHARRSLDAPAIEPKEDAGGPDNLWIAACLVSDIESVRAVQRELRSAFARSELDGGAKAAPRHPLYIEAEERLAELHDQLMMVI